MQMLYGSFVDDMECFNSSMFGISKAEAVSMSPSQRVLLECAYLALRDTGFEKSEIKGLNCGAFVGHVAASINNTFGSEKTSLFTAIPGQQAPLYRDTFHMFLTSKDPMHHMTLPALLHWLPWMRQHLLSMKGVVIWHLLQE